MSNRGKLLRVFIDKLSPKDITDSVNIDDCVLVSNQLGNVLTVEHDVDYDRLEVSSAGLDRVLKKRKILCVMQENVPALSYAWVCKI